MKTVLNVLGVFLSVGLTAATSMADTTDSSREAVKPRILDASDMPRAVALPLVNESAPTATPPSTAPVASKGEWIYAHENGYVWVPLHSVSYSVGNVPSAFLYTPELGWAWYASPWGDGAFAYGPWMGRPWALGFRAWTHGPEGWALRAAQSHAAVGGVFGVPGHYYDADGVEFRGDHNVRSAVRASRGEPRHEGAARVGGERSRGAEHGGGRGGGHGGRR